MTPTDPRTVRRPESRLALCFALALPLLAATASFGATPPAGGGGFQAPLQQECLSDDERSRIRQTLDFNKVMLTRRGQLPASTKASVSLSWPLAPAAGFTDPGYHGVSNFVDLDSNFPGSVLDYNCGARTYDLASGYNHRGIDYYTWPFWWYKMDHDQVEVVAAAPGTLIGKDDGNDDRSCSFGGAWNAAYVLHADGSEAWYGHLKNGSITSKPVGSAIAAGEYLGIAGSSGSSTNPHLHLELRDSGDDIVEPHAGPCQADASWWAEQRPYYDSTINLIATHDEPPVFPACPMTETPNFEKQFDPGATVHVALYFRDFLAGQVAELKMIMPDGNVWQTWQHSIADPPHYSGAYWYWTWFMPVAPEGIWTFEATYEGVTYSTRFGLGGDIFDDGFESGGTGTWSTAVP